MGVRVAKKRIHRRHKTTQSERGSIAGVLPYATEAISEGQDFIATIYQAVDMLNQTQLNLTLPINWYWPRRRLHLPVEL